MRYRVSGLNIYETNQGCLLLAYSRRVGWSPVSATGYPISFLRKVSILSEPVHRVPPQPPVAPFGLSDVFYE